MDDYNRGLMASEAAKLTKRGPLLEQFMQSLSTLNGQAQTLEQRLAEMSDRERSMLLQTSKFVQMAMRMKIAASDYSMGYLDMVNTMYGGMAIDKRQLIAELLKEAAPLSFTPKPKPKQSPQDMALGFYDRADMQAKPSQQETMEQATEQPIAKPIAEADSTTSFLDKLTQSESSGDTTAEITISDGRTFSGALQFGSARLADYKTATGSSFTQDEFKADSALQDQVAAWHVADIDKAIDALGDKASQYNRDGLRAVAHLGGKGGMKKYVQSKGSYNPADELGTSLQDYYDKFAVQS